MGIEKKKLRILSKLAESGIDTDGVPEATNAEDKQFGTDRTEAALNIKAEADPKEILKIVRASVDEFVGNAEQYDDLTMVCLEYKGVPEQGPGEDAAE